MTSVVVIDDEPAICRALRINLSARSYRVMTAYDGTSGLALVARERPDVVIVDLGLPDMDGADVIRGIRGWSTAPIIVLSARENEATKVAALDAGADDYVTKPFGMDELLARLRAAERRAAPVDDAPVITTADFTIDLSAKLVRTAAGDDVKLTPTQWQLLEILVRSRGQAGDSKTAAARRMGAGVRRGVELPARVRGATAAQARAGSCGAALPAHRDRHGISLRGSDRPSLIE